ncbi:LysR substrate-binding domain-containing protein [Sinanaerobacter chloroacetimidivorans]|uniref:LysR substrate-binding domain-containing protein n=1 Tax=Sinanaerobacter chloroacetimidivorans TaxID=2818044 RepID=UPI0029CA7D97|nr:LysR substrate-binding domain-containing protein [Sinanaerobacter chloroacetimidivorans]
MIKLLDYRIETFLAVCKYMNFTRAAEKMNITQPAVSQHIRYLEEEYGIKIFKYDGKKMKLTKEGETLLNAVTTIKHDDLFLREHLKELKGERRKLIFGTTLTIGEFVIPSHLAAYLHKYPDTSIQMMVANTYVLLEKLNNGEIDFAIIEGYFTKSEYDYLPYSREKYIPVCGPEYVFNGKGSTVEDLLNERLIVREPGSGTREILERTLGERNLTIQDFKNLVEISNMNAIKSLVQANCGITFLYEAAARKEITEGKLKEIPLGKYNVTHDFTFVWRKGSIFAERYKKLFAILKN